jgi:hemerythrin superfamily protein
MDPTRLLEADHRKVEALFEQISDAEGAERQAMVDDLETSLKAHMELEETVLYPEMAPVTGEEPVEEGNNEHKLGRQTLDEVVKLSPDGPGFEGALETLKAAIEHHVEDEEGKVFPKLRQDGSEILDSVSKRFLQTRRDLGLPTDAATLAEAMTKDDLVADAKAAGIEGHSSMTKEELAEALVSA